MFNASACERHRGATIFDLWPVPVIALINFV